MRPLRARSVRLSQHRRGNNRLPVAQSAIAGTNFAMLENLKSLRFELSSQQSRETAIVQAAAGERDLLNAGGGAGQNRGAHKTHAATPA